MDSVMEVLFGKMPFSQLPSVQAAVAQKNKNNTILLMGGIILVGGILAYKLYLENQELKIRLEADRNKVRE
jgi:hypothetical protein